MKEVIIANITQIIFQLLEFLVLILVATVLNALQKTGKAKRTVEAVETVRDTSMDTAAALQQTTVEHLKAASSDGKLTKDEVEMLKTALIDDTVKRLAPSVIALVNAAGMDLNDLILSAGDAWLTEYKAALASK